MLEISGLTHRIAGRLLFDDASAFIAEGWKAGLVGRNGAGKSTLLKMIRDEIQNEAKAAPIRLKRGATFGFVAQEMEPSPTPLIEAVLAANIELASLLAEAETATDPHRIGEIYARLADLDAYSAQARASSILVGLGFSQSDLNRPCADFSGGWRMRAALAGVLFSQPDLLVLDEPTNYLDLEGAAWLEDYLQDYPHTVLVVSHDREMLNRSVTHILALADQKLEVFAGGYDAYLKRRAERMAGAASQKAKQDAERAHLQAFVDRFRAKASKARQAQSRVKKLEKMQSIAVPVAERALPFVFPQSEELASPLIVLEHADLGYVPGKPVLRDVSFRLDHDDRIGIVGPNGQGKTTLVKSIAAKLALQKGQRHAARAARIGYFSQDQLDELRAGETALDHVRELLPNLAPRAHRAIAAQIGFGEQKIETPVEKLSGGEKVRLALGLIAQSKPHILVLDEPTSHLDIDSREALIHALNDFNGAILLITHDVFLAEACVDRLWLVHGGRARPYDGDLADYRKLVLSADRPVSHASAEIAPAAEASPAPAKRASASTLARKLKDAEAALTSAQSALAAIDARLAEPALFSRDPAAAAALAKQRAAATAALEAAEEAWLEAGAALEANLA